MHIKHLISAAAIALVAGLGAAEAAEQFETLGNEISATQLDEHELDAVHGQAITIRAILQPDLVITAGLSGVSGVLAAGTCGGFGGTCAGGGPLDTPGSN